MKISQNPKELEMMLEFMRQHKVKSVLEIGSRYGDTLQAMAELGGLSKDGTVVSVELPNAGWGRADSLPILSDHIARLENKGFDAHLILGDSKDKNVIKKALSLGPFDFVFIDGDHTYKGAFNDWMEYGLLVDSKYVGFHDINTSLEVADLWQDIKKEHLHAAKLHEFIADDGPEMGIGIVEWL